MPPQAATNELTNTVLTNTVLANTVLANDVADAVRRLQGTNPLAEVVLVTPPGPTAQALRRLLPSTISADGRQTGVIGARFETPIDLARSIVRDLDGVQPTVTPLMLAAAVTRELDDLCPDVLRNVAHSPSTIDAITQIAERVRLLPDDDSISFAGASRGRAALLDVANRARRRLRRHHLDEYDTLARAERILGDSKREGADNTLGGLPERMVLVVTDCFHPGQLRFISALVTRVPTVDIVTMPVSEDDTDLVAQITAVGATPTYYTTRVRPRLVSCPDQDEEVRTAVRSIAALLRKRARPTPTGADTSSDAATPNDPVPVILDDLAIMYPTTTGYLRAITDELDRARIPWVGTAPQLLRESMVGTVVRLALAALDEPTRDNLITLAQAAPFRSTDDEPTRTPSYWRRVATEARLATPDDWVGLPEVVAQWRAAASPDTADSTDVAALASLGVFVDRLLLTRSQLDDAPSWGAAIDALQGYLRYLVGPVDRGLWLHSEPWQLRAVEQVQRGLDGLRVFDGTIDDAHVDGRDGYTDDDGTDDLTLEFRVPELSRIARQILEQPTRSTGLNGTGVRVRPITDGVCSEGEVIYVVGVNDAVLPAPRSEEMFRPRPDDPEAAYVEHCFWQQRKTTRGWHRLVQSGADVTVSWSRADMRHGGELYPSALLEPYADDAAGTIIEDDRVRSHIDSLINRESLNPAESFIARPANRTAVVDADADDVDVDDVDVDVDDVDVVDADNVDDIDVVEPILKRRLEAQHSRQLPIPTRFDGQVAGQLTERPEFAATHLERLATCGISYFLRHTLGVFPEFRVRPDDAISPRDRGDLVHRTLERIVADWLADDDRPAWLSNAHLGLGESGLGDDAGDDGSVDDDQVRAALSQLAKAYFARGEEELAESGMIANLSLWELERDLYITSIVEALAIDRTEGVRPLAAEYRFGPHAAQRYIYESAFGPIDFVGTIDRIDLVADRTRVTDYKSTTAQRPNQFPADGTDQGRMLQLPLYALVAADHFASPATEPRYLYLHGEKATARAPRADEMDIDALTSAFGEQVDHLVGRIANGDFRPGAPDPHRGCDDCSPDGLGTDEVLFRAITLQAHDGDWDDSAPELDPELATDAISTPTGYRATSTDVAATPVDPVDLGARQQATSGLRTPLIVVAGAGSGKTTVLVERVANELNADPTLASRLVMITFTEKAARELRDRVRLAAPGAPLDEAYIGTIHGFCSSILHRFPIEAGLPPRFDNVGDLSAATDARERARSHINAVYRFATQPESSPHRADIDEGAKGGAADPADARQTADEPLSTAQVSSAQVSTAQVSTAQVSSVQVREALTFLARRHQLRNLSSLALKIDAQWTTFESAALPPTRTTQELLDEIATRTQPLRDLYAMVPPGHDDDLFVMRLREIDDILDTLPASFDALGRIDLKGVGSGGKNAPWETTSLGTAREAKHEVKELLDGKPVQAVIADEALRRVLHVLAPIVLTDAKARVAGGLVTYDDLLILTRRLIMNYPDVLNELRGSFGQLYVDEFQDTDAVQFDIIADLTGRPRVDGTTAPATPHPPAVLFLVGDPKQAIYAFRDADPTLLNEAAERAREAPDADQQIVDLVMNFRSQPAVCQWINQVVGARFCSGDDEELDTLGQAPYEDLVPSRASLANDSGPPVCLIGFNNPDAPVPFQSASSADATVAEVSDLVRAVRRAVGADGEDPWHVRDTTDASGGHRAARYADIAVLIRSRSNLSAIEFAFRAAEIPYRVEGGTLLYENREVYELLRVLRAIDHLDDSHAVVTALRTSVFGIGDDQILAFKKAFHYWHLPAPERIARLGDSSAATIGPVIEALASLQRWAELSNRLNPAQLLSSLYDSTFGATAAIATEGAAAAETLRRVRFAIDEARAWTDETGGTLGEYLDWVDARIEQTDRTELSTNEDEDAVRIMTIHASKGLQFPIVMVAGLGRRTSTAQGIQAADVDGNIAVAFSKEIRTANFATPRGGDSYAEEARLIYVAFTRAEDHLVVSGHTDAKAGTGTPIGRLSDAIANTPTPLLGVPRGATTEPTVAAVPAPLPNPPSTRPGHAPGHPPGPAPSHRSATLFRPLVASTRRTVWTPSALATEFEQRRRAQRDDLTVNSPETLAVKGAAPSAHESLPVGWAAYARERIDPGLRKDPILGVVQERSKGRYGSAVGTAVHEVLQLVDLSSPHDDLKRLAQVAADNAEVPEAGERVARLASSIIDTDLFAEMAAASRVEREIYVGTRFGTSNDDPVVWGYIDAVFGRPDGLVVVDFKTDAVDGDVAALHRRYAPQLSAYAAAVARATNQPVAAAYLLVAGRDDQRARTVQIDPLTPERELLGIA